MAKNKKQTLKAMCSKKWAVPFVRSVSKRLPASIQIPTFHERVCAMVKYVEKSADALNKFKSNCILCMLAGRSPRWPRAGRWTEWSLESPAHCWVAPRMSACWQIGPAEWANKYTWKFILAYCISRTFDWAAWKKNRHLHFGADSSPVE